MGTKIDQRYSKLGENVYQLKKYIFLVEWIFSYIYIYNILYWFQFYSIDILQKKKKGSKLFQLIRLFVEGICVIIVGFFGERFSKSESSLSKNGEDK